MVTHALAKSMEAERAKPWTLARAAQRSAYDNGTRTSPTSLPGDDAARRARQQQSRGGSARPGFGGEAIVQEACEGVRLIPVHVSHGKRGLRGVLPDQRRSASTRNFAGGDARA